MLDFLIVVICLLINAFFSAYEMAFVTLSREEMEELNAQGNTYKKLSLFKKKPERTLSVIQVGISLVGAIAAAVGGTGAVEGLGPWLIERYNVSSATAQAISVTLVIIPLTYVSVVFGELIPKSIALKHPLRVIKFGTRILSLIDGLLSPVVTLLEVSTYFFLKLLGISKGSEENENLGEIIEIGELAPYHQRYVQNLVALKGRRVQKTMIPWKKVISLKLDESEEAVRQKIYQSHHSRFPVCDSDKVVGILLKKELPDSKFQDITPWQKMLKPIQRYKQDAKVLEVFLRMQEQKIALALVEDSEKNIKGIITIKDIVEEVVGDIDEKIDISKASRLLSHRPRIKF